MSAAAATPVRRPKAKLVFFIVFGLLTVFVIYMKNRGFFDPASETAKHFEPILGFLYIHGFFGVVALLLGAFQLSNRLRARYLGVHRTLGYVYIICVFVAAPFAIPVAMGTGTPSLVAASVAQAAGWMVCTAIALYCVRNGNIIHHRRWMIRGYFFAMVFTVVRLIIPIPPIFALGNTGVEMVVWSVIVLAAFLPSILLDWRAIAMRPVTKQTMAMAIEHV